MLVGGTEAAVDGRKSVCRVESSSEVAWQYTVSAMSDAEQRVVYGLLASVN